MKRVFALKCFSLQTGLVAKGTSCFKYPLYDAVSQSTNELARCMENREGCMETTLEGSSEEDQAKETRINLR